MEGPETAERTLDRCLDARARAAVREVVRQVRLRVPAELVYAALFGSRARGDARADSDVDLLLVWRNLPPDREPQAGHAEAIAAEVAERSGVPVGVWSVAMEDLEEGRRTPMLVDALDDAVPVWPAEHPPPRVPFTPADAVFCAGRMLDRVDEGSAEVAGSLRRGDGAWVRRVRDDVVRLCTALLVLAGDTRPRRGDAVRAFAARSPAWVRSRGEARALAWVARSYPPGHLELDDLPPVPPPPVSANVLLGVAERLRNEVRRRLRNALRSTGFVCR
jgi:predicted nucleotidyltransferase